MSLSFLNHWMFPHYWVAPINLLYYLPLWKEKSSPTFLSSCHPISMLSYTWKILEKVIYTHCLHLVSYHSLLKPFLPQFFPHLLCNCFCQSSVITSQTVNSQTSFYSTSQHLIHWLPLPSTAVFSSYFLRYHSLSSLPTSLMAYISVSFAGNFLFDL